MPSTEIYEMLNFQYAPVASGGIQTAFSEGQTKLCSSKTKTDFVKISQTQIAKVTLIQSGQQTSGEMFEANPAVQARRCMAPTPYAFM